METDHFNSIIPALVWRWSTLITVIILINKSALQSINFNHYHWLVSVSTGWIRKLWLSVNISVCPSLGQSQMFKSRSTKNRRTSYDIPKNHTNNLELKCNFSELPKKLSYSFIQRAMIDVLINNNCWNIRYPFLLYLWLWLGGNENVICIFSHVRKLNW